MSGRLKKKKNRDPQNRKTVGRLHPESLPISAVDRGVTFSARDVLGRPQERERCNNYRRYRRRANARVHIHIYCIFVLDVFQINAIRWRRAELSLRIDVVHVRKTNKRKIKRARDRPERDDVRVRGVFGDGDGDRPIGGTGDAGGSVERKIKQLARDGPKGF